MGTINSSFESIASNKQGNLTTCFAGALETIEAKERTASDPSEALQAEMMKLHAELNDSSDTDELDFVGGTAQAVAYERNIESKGKDHLFNDTLAKHFVGTKGEKCSKMFNKHLGLAYRIENVHIEYMGVRTKLINDNLESCIEKRHGDQMQCVNLGARADTRVFWLESLKKVQSYIEVVTAKINNYKDKVKPLCERRVISLNFSTLAKNQ